MGYKKMWREITEASNLTDLAAEAHGHDLLDGYDHPPNLPLHKVFSILCRRASVIGWRNINPVLDKMRTIDGFEGLRLPDEVMAQVVEEMETGPAIGITDHTSVRRGTYSDAWGTPDAILTAVRSLYGPITHDLASSGDHNKRIRAGTIWTQDDPCPGDPPIGRGHVVWCNPPGPCTRVAEFWAIWQGCLDRGAIGAFLLFKQDHWRQLPAPARSLPCIVLRRRLKFEGADGGANFPSTLVLSHRSDNWAIARGLGHVVAWEPVGEAEA